MTRLIDHKICRHKHLLLSCQERIELSRKLGVTEQQVEKKTFGWFGWVEDDIRMEITKKGRMERRYFGLLVIQQLMIGDRRHFCMRFKFKIHFSHDLKIYDCKRFELFPG